MAPSKIDEPILSFSQANTAEGPYTGPPRNLASISALKFDKHLQPKEYKILGTNPESKILFTDVSILDSTGRDPYRGDVLIEGERITKVGIVPDAEELKRDPKVRIFQGSGRTLMSGLGDAHTHFTWNGGDIPRLGEMEVEEHTLVTVKSAKCYLDAGYTILTRYRCFGAASAKNRLDVVVRNAINAGYIPGPRYLANASEIANPAGTLGEDFGGALLAETPEKMRQIIQSHSKLGADQIKLYMSGEEITERSAQDCYYTDEETITCVEEAHKLGLRVCAHARACESVKKCAKHGVDVIYHASYTDDEGMDLLEARKDNCVVAPGLNWIVATLYDAAAFGYTTEKAEQVGYKKELDIAIRAMREMHRCGIVVLPGGDYGFAWTPHGTYARDLEQFVTLLGFTPMESIIAATFGIAQLMTRGHELGKIEEGYYGDCILVDGNPLADISILQDHDKLNVIVINGRVHKAGRKEYVPTLGPN
ncbi:isoaspartyl dipeptidase-like protein [Xylogone sp. PMI_703]|nr:isoaspartyl dipeptidase-like protein [Xylogone sp. PMI_703]